MVLHRNSVIFETILLWVGLSSNVFIVCLFVCKLNCLLADTKVVVKITKRIISDGFPFMIFYFCPNYSESFIPISLIGWTDGKPHFLMNEICQISSVLLNAVYVFSSCERDSDRCVF